MMFLAPILMQSMRSPARSAPGLLSFVLLTMVSAACASTGSVPRPFPGAPVVSSGPGTAEMAPPLTSAGLIPALLDTALDLRGIPYRNGGSSPDGFDCSGFTQWVFAQHGIALPREVREQYRVGERVRRDELEAGDLLFFSTTGSGATHVAIALGPGELVEFVHAPSSTGVVRVERLQSSYWAPRFIGARRVVSS
jgi:cell wall-associated NlpC family hydrolase